MKQRYEKTLKSNDYTISLGWWASDLTWSDLIWRRDQFDLISIWSICDFTRCPFGVEVACGHTSVLSWCSTVWLGPTVTKGNCIISKRGKYHGQLTIPSRGLICFSQTTLQWFGKRAGQFHYDVILAEKANFENWKKGETNTAMSFGENKFASGGGW